jgi:NAD(P)-dependent dehydrogenase (short-subunit alcohol dehydrogenase family)
VPLADVRALFETNVFGAIRMIQGVVPQMRERGSGVLVNVSSVQGRVARPLSGFYAATKFAMEALSEALLVEVGHWGIRMVVIQPGFIDTGYEAAARSFGAEPGSPYAELQVQSDRVRERFTEGGAPGPEIVAHAIADAIENPDAWGRIPVGADAEMVMAARASMDDETFLATMRKVLDLTW